MPPNVTCACDSSFNFTFCASGSWFCIGHFCCQLVRPYFSSCKQIIHVLCLGLCPLCLRSVFLLVPWQISSCCLIPVVLFASVFSSTHPHRSPVALAVILILWGRGFDLLLVLLKTYFSNACFSSPLCLLYFHEENGGNTELPFSFHAKSLKSRVYFSLTLPLSLDFHISKAQ